MWADNETDRDFLNFRHVAELASEMILQAEGARSVWGSPAGGVLGNLRWSSS